MRQFPHETNCSGDWKAVFIQAKSDAFYLKILNSRCFVPGFVGIDVFWNMPLKISQHIELGYFVLWKTFKSLLVHVKDLLLFFWVQREDIIEIAFTMNFFLKSLPSSSKPCLTGLIDVLHAPADNSIVLSLQPISYQLHVLLWEAPSPLAVGFGGW